MKKTIFLIIIVFSTISQNINAQSGFSRVPKVKSLEINYKYQTSNPFKNTGNQGYGLVFDYAWQLSGFTGRPAGFISVIIGYHSVMPSSDTGKSLGLLWYGWNVRHQLKPINKIQPFFGYSLLLTQARIEDIDGSIFGHQTKFDFGIDFLSTRKLKHFIKLEYAYTRFPKFGQKGSYHMQGVDLGYGIRF